MVGQGVLRECLLDGGVTAVLCVGRSRTGQQHPKLGELVHDPARLDEVKDQLSGYDACFFCLGVSSAGMSEDEYRRITYDLTLSAARVLLGKNPAMTFIYVSGAGTDGRAMWARVKSKTEKDLAQLGFRATYMFRPAAIQPLHGITSRTRMYRAFYAVFGPLLPLMRRIFPGFVTTTEVMGRAMIRAARNGAPKSILENSDINALGA